MGWFKRRRSRDGGPLLIYATEAEAEAARARAAAAGLEPGYGSLKKDGNQYVIFRGSDPEKAKQFLLDLPPVDEERFYYVVETTDGNWGRDIEGLYLENLRPWQRDVAAAECRGAIVSVPSTGSVITAARGHVDNFIVQVGCGKCSSQWYDGLRYQDVTAVRCPACGVVNKVDSGSIVVHLH